MVHQLTQAGLAHSSVEEGEPDQRVGVKSKQTDAFAQAATHWNNEFRSAFGAHHDVSLPDGCGVSSELRAALRSSLPTFQVGESGDGSRLKAGARTTNNAAYSGAIDYFVVEEQEHARLLALILNDLGQPLRDSHWTDAVFVFLRHGGGLRVELLILMVAELVSVGYYQTLATGCGKAPVAKVFQRIADDEKRHLSFHFETIPLLLQQWPTPMRWLSRATWTAVAATAAVLVAVDHRRVLASCGVTKRRFIAKTWCLIAKAGAVMFQDHPSSGVGC